MRVAIVGAGNFGTAVANMVAQNGADTYLWMRDREQLADIRACGENRRYLPGHPLAERVQPTADLARAVGASDLLFVTVPQRFVPGRRRGTAGPRETGRVCRSAPPKASRRRAFG